MSTQEEIEFREEQRLSRALTGKVGANKRVTSWAPVKTTSTPTTPVNYSGAPPSGGSVDTSSPYANTATVVENEKLRQEQARLKKWGLDLNEDQSSSASSSNDSTPSLKSSTSIEQNLDDQAKIEERRLTKMGLSSNNLIDDYNIPSRPVAAPAPQSSAPVDNSSILSNVDAHTSEEKMRQEQKRLERWGFFGGVSSTPSTPTSKPVNTPSSPRNEDVTPSPFTNAPSAAAASQYSIPVATVQTFLTKIINAAKAVKLIIHKKSSNHDIATAILMDIVKESATFTISLPADLAISFDVSKNSGKLAGAVNELIKGGADREPSQTAALYDEIQNYLGQLYIAVVAN